MAEYTNLGWPQTPFGADKRPFPRQVRLLAATALHRARNVPVAAGLVYLPIPRTGSRQICASTLHAGYRVQVPESTAELPVLADLVDGHLVQARRHAQALALHDWSASAALLRSVTAGQAPGITAVTEAWAARPGRERGIAPVIEAAPGASLVTASTRRGLSFIRGPGGLLSGPEVLRASSAVLGGAGDPAASERTPEVEVLGFSVLCQALLIALLAAAEMGRCTWSPPLAVDEVLSSIAWDAFPQVASPALTDTPEPATVTRDP